MKIPKKQKSNLHVVIYFQGCEFSVYRLNSVFLDSILVIPVIHPDLILFLFGGKGGIYLIIGRSIWSINPLVHEHISSNGSSMKFVFTCKGLEMNMFECARALSHYGILAPVLIHTQVKIS